MLLSFLTVGMRILLLLLGSFVAQELIDSFAL